MASNSFQDSSIQSFRSEVSSWLEQNVEPYKIPAEADEPRQIEIRRAWEERLNAAGYNALAWPTEFGGKGLGPIEEFVFAEEAIKVGAPEPLGRIGRLLVAPGLFVHGTRKQQDRYLSAILACKEIWCQGFSEPNAGSDLASLRTTARLNGDHYVVNGQKVWTTFGHYADYCLLLARTGEAGGRHRGLTMFALPMRQPGVRPQPIKQISGEADFNEVFFDDAVVPAENVIGGDGNGWKVALTVLMAERGAGFAALKIKRISEEMALLEKSLKHRSDLASTGQKLDTQFSIMRWQVMRAVERMAADRNPLPSASILKLVWSELGQRIARFGVETDEAETRDQWRFLELALRMDTIASGTSEIQRNIVAERVLGLPR